jgi:hypothetical protein
MTYVDIYLHKRSINKDVHLQWLLRQAGVRVWVEIPQDRVIGELVDGRRLRAIYVDRIVLWGVPNNGLLLTIGACSDGREAMRKAERSVLRDRTARFNV